MTTVNLQKPASEKMITWQTRKPKKQGRRVASRQPHRLEIAGSIPAPATNNNGGEMKMKQDPILAEVASQICSSGICLAEPKKKSKLLPICSPSQAKALEKCILDVKAKLPAKCKSS